MLFFFFFLLKTHFVSLRVPCRKKETKRKCNLLEISTLALPTATIKYYCRAWCWLSSSVPQAL